MKRFYSLFICLFFVFHASAQHNFTINGYIEDTQSGEKLISANVFDARSGAGITTNTYGFYSLTLPQGEVDMVFSYLGYQPVTMKFDLNRDTTLNIRLIPQSVIKEVVVVAEKKRKIQKETQMSRVTVPVEQIEKVPALLGEVDVLKVLQLLPGVQSGGEGQSGLYVRGGSPDQNLILLDGVPVYNVSHLLGFFSVFNSDAIKNVTLTKGGFPARYGGRLSSVLEINMKEGNNKEFHGEGSIGIISSRLTLEGPIKSEKTSFMISGRRTYADLLARPFIKAQNTDRYSTKAKLYFYDLNAKINHKINDKHRLFLSAYLGSDVFGLNETYKFNQTESEDGANIDWGNITAAFRWNYIINKKLFANTTLTYSKFRFNFGVLERYKDLSDGGADYSFSGRYFSGINDVAGKVDFDFFPDPAHYIRFGIGNTYHTYNPGALVLKDEEAGLPPEEIKIAQNKRFSHEAYSYIEDDMTFGALKANVGVHLSFFNTRKTYYVSPQPRLGLRYLLNDRWSLKASFATMTQYINLLTNESLSLPTDLWVPSTETIKPQKSWQAAFGTATTLNNNIELSAEAYYKKMTNVVSYKEGATFLNEGADWQTKITQGNGTAYGIELLAQKKYGKLSGWIGYTLAWNIRQFDDINSGKAYPFKYDRRHDFELVATYKLRDRITLSGTWVYGTGNAISLPLAEYHSGGYRKVLIYGGKNSFRMPAYHRLDLSVEFSKKKRWGRRAWIFGVYNAYSRKNPYYLFIGYDPATGKESVRQLSLFPIVPSVSYQFKF